MMIVSLIFTTTFFIALLCYLIFTLVFNVLVFSVFITGDTFHFLIGCVGRERWPRISTCFYSGTNKQISDTITTENDNTVRKCIFMLMVSLHCMMDIGISPSILDTIYQLLLTLT